MNSEHSEVEEQEQLFRELVAQRRMALEDANAGSFSVDVTTGRITWSDELHQLYGIAAGTFSGRIQDWMGYIVPEDRARVASEIQLAIASATPSYSPFRIHRADTGAMRCIKPRYEVVYTSEGCPPRLVGINTDITEQLTARQEFQTLENRLRHAQKMELIGHLASGVAHDFNNLLMVIRAQTELLEAKLPAAEADLSRHTQQVVNASTRAANLTAQLLAFSRKETPKPTTLDLSIELAKMTDMLRRLIGANIDIQLLSDQFLWPVRANADQIMQILMNLCVNSRDAMPKGGAITIETRNEHVSDGRRIGKINVRPGDYVTLSVKDTGTGVSEQDMEHMFDPFFTTKPVGRGTGLGLSIVYGIVKQANGYIAVNSQVGSGTTFTIYLPRTEMTADPDFFVKGHDPELRGNEVVLVVEDEISLRDSICEFLHRYGYTTLSAVDGEQALLVAGRYPGSIDLLITDLNLPRVGGRQLSRGIRELHPKIKVVYISGHSDRTELELAGKERSTAFLMKPFSLKQLAKTMQDLLLDSGETPGTRSA